MDSFKKAKGLSTKSSLQLPNRWCPIRRNQNNEMAFQVQDESKATYWPGRKPEDGRLNLNGSVIDAERLVRAVTHPYPGAFINKDGIKIVIWKAVVTNDSFEGRVLYFPDGVLGLIDFDEYLNNETSN